VICRGFPLLFFSIWKLCCFVIWLGVGTNLCYWLRLFCTLVDHSGAISLVWTTRGFYPWFEGFSTLKILVPLFVLLVIYYCCSLIIAPHRFLQVRGNYIRCILWYIVCCCFPHHVLRYKIKIILNLNYIFVNVLIFSSSNWIRFLKVKLEFFIMWHIYVIIDK